MPELKGPEKKWAPPKTRIGDASNARSIANELNKADEIHSKRRGRIFRQYNRYAPTEYSELLKDGLGTTSNVCFGDLAMAIDNAKSGFYDMITERVEAARITTKIGNAQQRKIWSDMISTAWDQVLRKWDGYLQMVETTQEEMLLYGKSVCARESKQGWHSSFIPLKDFKVPEKVKADLSDMDVCCIKREYPLFKLWNIVKNDEARAAGWNRDCAFRAIYRAAKNEEGQSDSLPYGSDEYYKLINESGFFSEESALRQCVTAWEILAKEYDKKISKHLILSDAPDSDDEYMFSDMEYAGDWPDVICPFTDSLGANTWRSIIGLGERLYLQCRNSDRMMNRVIDAVETNMMLIIQGGDANSQRKLNEKKWTRFNVLPSDCTIAQHKMELPVADAVSVNQVIMDRLSRGVGQYEFAQTTVRGQPMTATQRRMDAVEGSKITGTQLSRYNQWNTRWNRMSFMAFVGTKAGEDGYELKKWFDDFLERHGVPSKAFEKENIESIESVMLSGAGSPSTKLMASEKTIAITNIVPKDEGQFAAMQDAIATLNGRQNVERYLKQPEQDPSPEDRIILHENELLKNPRADVGNVVVIPQDNDVKHASSHVGEAARIAAMTEEAIQKGNLDASTQHRELSDIIQSCRNVLVHAKIHLSILARDETKESALAQLSKAWQEVYGKTMNWEAQVIKARRAEAEQAQQTQQQSASADPKVQAAMATQSIKLQTMQKESDIKLSAAARKAQMDLQISEQKAAQQLAADAMKTKFALEREAGKAVTEESMQQAKIARELAKGQEKETEGKE